MTYFVRLIALLILMTDCMPFRSSGPAPAARVAGAYSARVAVTGRSTYTGSIEITAVNGDSVRGVMKLTSPISVDVILRGRATSDSLVLVGGYTGSNGCSGDFRSSLLMPTATSGTGPFQLADKCAGTLSGIMTVSR
jgi:hypothetical protein